MDVREGWERDWREGQERICKGRKKRLNRRTEIGIGEKDRKRE